MIVEGKWVIEAGFDAQLGGLERVMGGVDPHASLPQSGVAQDAC